MQFVSFTVKNTDCNSYRDMLDNRDKLKRSYRDIC